MKRLALALFLIVPFAGPALAQTAAPPTPAAQIFPIPLSGVVFITGDTWQQYGQQMRLYGVQSCIRGTSYTNQVGTRQDCGEASLAILAALVRDTKPTCAPIARLPGTNNDPPTVLVVCTAHVGANVLDLGGVLIDEGYAFAAIGNDAKPVYMPYLVAELTAKKAHRGLWASSDLPHPFAILSKAVNAAK